MESYVQPVSPTAPEVPVANMASNPGRRARRMQLLKWGGSLAALALVGILGFSQLPGRSGTHAASSSTSAPHDAMSVTAVRPERKTLVRTMVQPGTIEPWSEAELYARASGYVQLIQFEGSPRGAAMLLAGGLAGATTFSGTPMVSAANVAAVHDQVLAGADEKDIGSRVFKNQLLMIVDSPERMQAVVEQEALWEQRQAELEAARSALDTFEAEIEAAKAKRLHADADIQRCLADLDFCHKQAKRFRALVVRQAINDEVAEEKEQQLATAESALQAARARRQSSEAEVNVAGSKLLTARAELKVKEKLVKVAYEEWHRARILDDFTRLTAPFDGIITYRGVDVGDFVQNSTSGQTRRLMTITAIDRVKIVLQVPARESEWIKPGAKATFTLDSRPGWVGVGHVGRTNAMLDTQSRTRRVEIDLDNKDGRLLPGMYGQVTVVLQEIRDAWTVPASAVHSYKGENYIIDVDEAGSAHRQRVHILFDNGKELQVAKVLDGREIPCDGSEELIVSNKGEIAEGQKVAPSLLAGPKKSMAQK